MFVNRQTMSCNSCDFDPVKGESVIVDIPLENIKLEWSPVLCENCGYFYSERHYPVSFTKWKVAKTIADRGLKESDKMFEEIEHLKDVVSPERYALKMEYANNCKADILATLEKLGDIPVPDHLFKD